MKGYAMRLMVAAMAAILVLTSVAFASEQKAEDDNLTEGQIEEYAYDKRADAVKVLEDRMQDIEQGLDKLAEEFKDSEIKKAFVDEMKELAEETNDVIKQLNNADETVWPELKEKAAAVMDKLEAFYEKMEKELTQ